MRIVCDAFEKKCTGRVVLFRANNFFFKKKHTFSPNNDVFANLFSVCVYALIPLGECIRSSKLGLLGRDLFKINDYNQETLHIH